MNTTTLKNLAAATTAAALIAAWPTSATEAHAQATPQPGQQVALVTGSTSGLGRELALRLGARGDHVIVHGRSEERGAEVVDAINAAGPGSARFYRADFASLDEVRQLAETLLADYDRLDVLINNAGFGSAPDERLAHRRRARVPLPSELPLHLSAHPHAHAAPPRQRAGRAS